MNEVFKTIHDYINALLAPKYYLATPTSFDLSIQQAEVDQICTSTMFLRRDISVEHPEDLYAGYVIYSPQEVKITISAIHISKIYKLLKTLNPDRSYGLPTFKPNKPDPDIANLNAEISQVYDLNDQNILADIASQIQLLQQLWQIDEPNE